MNSPLLLIMLSAFFLNMPLQMGIGVREIFLERENSFLDIFWVSLLLFVSLLIQWLLFAFVFSPLSLGFFKYFLILPLNAVVPSCVALATQKIIPHKTGNKKNVFVFPYRSGAGLVALLIMLYLASSLASALVLAAGFSLGVFFSMAALRAIRFRAEREDMHPLLRGIPLLLIAMGLLSLAFNSITVLYIK